jgi:hypothetical protein
MKLSHHWLAGLYTVLLLLAGCGPKAAAQEATISTRKEEPSRVEQIDGTHLSRVILSEEAADRLDIHTEEVQQAEVDGAPRAEVPYAAILYDVEGATWVYTSPEQLTFVRSGVDVESIDGDTAILSQGPPVGTPVVTVGATELFGAEFEFEAG